jgi:hypothetical protein
MAQLTITNQTSDPVYIKDLYTSVPVGTPLVVDRSATDLASMTGLQDAVAAGQVTMSITYSAAEQPLATAPDVVEAVDAAPVTAGTVEAPPITIRHRFAAGGGGAPDDVTIYAVNTFPYKVRMLDVTCYIDAAVGASTVELRTAAGGGGSLLGDFDSATTGRKKDAAQTITPVIVPGAPVGLFVRRSDSGVAGDIVLTCRREV